MVKRIVMAIMMLMIATSALAELSVNINVVDSNNEAENIRGYQVFRGTTEATVDYTLPLNAEVDGELVSIITPGTTNFKVTIPPAVEDEDHYLAIVVVDHLMRKSEACTSIRLVHAAPLVQCSGTWSSGQ